MPEGSKFYIQGGLILDTADAQAERTGGVVIAGGTDVEVHVAAVAAMDRTAPVVAPAACEVERAIDIAPACRNKLQGRGERPGGVLVAPSVKFTHSASVGNLKPAGQGLLNWCAFHGRLSANAPLVQIAISLSVGHAGGHPACA